MHSVAAQHAVGFPPEARPLDAANGFERFRDAVEAADIVRIDLSEAESNEVAAAHLVAELSNPSLRVRSLWARIPLGYCQSKAAMLLAAAADTVEVRVPHTTAATKDAGVNSPAVADLVQNAKMRGRPRVRAIFEVSRRTAGRLDALVVLAAEAGFKEIGFEPLFVMDEREIDDSLFFHPLDFNRELDEALKTAKRRNVFVDAVKFGSQGRAANGVSGRKRTLIISLDREGIQSDGWVATGKLDPLEVSIAGKEILAIDREFRHMDLEASHFDHAVLASAAFKSRKAAAESATKFTLEFEPLFARYGLDPAVYVNSMRTLQIESLPLNTTNQEETIGLLNAAIESGFLRTVDRGATKVVVGLTKPFIGINWGASQQHLLPDQRQLWRTFNQWQTPTVFVTVSRGYDYQVRTVVHNGSPGDVIEHLQLSCNGYVPENQAISWEGFACLHICTIPAKVVHEAAGKLCVSFVISRPSETGPPAEVGLRSISFEAAAPAKEAAVQNDTPIRRALTRLRSAIELKPSLAPSAAERRSGFGKPIPSIEFEGLDVYGPQAAIIAVTRDYAAIVEGQEKTVAAFACLLAELIKRGDIPLAVERTLAQNKDLVTRRVHWIKFSPVEHRYLDTDATYEFFSVLRLMLGEIIPASEVLSFFRSVVEKNSALRPAWLAIADCYLEAGRYDEAIEAARSATHRDVCCVTSQEVLRKIYLAKFPNSTDSVIDGVPLYDLSGRFCSVPFDRIETAKDGIVWTCCPAWLGAPIGNMHHTEWEAAWNSDQAGLMRESILDGSFKYCNSGVCPAILAGNLPKKSDVTDPYFRHYIDNNIVKIPEGPREVSISHDPSCNLACPQCRQDFILADDVRNAEYKETIDSFVKPLIEFAEIDRSTILMSGDGEIFVSPHYREILKLFDPEKHAHLGINLLSNGLVFEAGWKKVPNIHKLVRSVTISTDGASEEVYRITRGGSWKKLYRNLRYISGLRRAGEIKKFGIHYAVQICNYKDMKRMVEIGLELGVDRIAFAILRNGGVYEPADYAARCIFEASHPQHGDFVTELEDPIFQSPIVDMTQFVGFRGEAAVA